MVSALMLVALSGASAAPLAYKMPAGSQFTLNTVTDAELPIVGAKHAIVDATVKVESATADAMVLQQTIVAQTPGKPNVTINLGATLSSEGRISNITGVNLDDPKFALVAKNAALALPQLPNEEVTVGMTWQDEKPLSLPKVPVPGIPESVRLITDYKVTGIAKVDGGEHVTIAMTIHEAEGKLKVSASGTFVVDAATGRPVSSHMEGEATVRVVIKTFRIPFKTDITVK